MMKGFVNARPRRTEGMAKMSSVVVFPSILASHFSRDSKTLVLLHRWVLCVHVNTTYTQSEHLLLYKRRF